MAYAMQQSLDSCARAIIIGTDCTELTSSHIKNIINDLKNGYEASLIPAFDGGYVLIGLRQFDESLFTQIDWGSGSVMSQTTERLNNLGWNWKEHPCLNDVDRKEDVERLINAGFRF